MISIDTLRADRLGCYGYARDTSPALDRFAATRAVRYEHAIAECSWTLPSHVTMLSGLHPLEHGVRLPDETPSPDVELLAERLQREGYYGFAITDGGWLSEGWGFDRGFESFLARDQDFADTVREATEFIRYRSDKGPWFGFLHTYDVHCPYDPPEPWFSMFSSENAEPTEVADRCGSTFFNSMQLTEGQVRYLSDRYDGGIRWVDEALGGLFRFLDDAGAWRNTVVIITSDHGEELGEHGRIGHEETLFGEALHVPLLLAAPGLAPAVERAPTGLADVKGMALALLGLEPAPTHARESVFSELAWKASLISVWRPEEHAILDREQNRIVCFDLDRDPGEERDTSRDAPEHAAVRKNELELLFAEKSENTRRPGRHEGTRDELEKLGYGY